jgi:predicted RND superfamily exporter protein
VERFDDPEDHEPSAADVLKRTSQARRERLRDPQVLAAIDRLTGAAMRVRGVRKVVSITEYLKEVNRVMHGGAVRHFTLPTDRRVIATYLELVAGQDAGALENLITTDRSAANVTIMSRAHSSADVRRILTAIEDELARPEIRSRLGADIAVDVTGLGPLLSSVADRIVAGQLKSCFLALGVICLMFVLVLWSLRTALVALVPNVLPILFTLGLMGWIGVTLNVTTVMIASIALGIAVDDTIHMLVRTRQETRRHGDHLAGLGQALASSGQAIVITTVVVGGGFLVLLLASLIPPRNFGWLTALTMAVALAADLLLLPVLILWLRPWHKQASRQAPAGEGEGEGEA